MTTVRHSHPDGLWAHPATNAVVFLSLMLAGGLGVIGLFLSWPPKPFSELTPADGWLRITISQRCLLLAFVSGWVGGVVYSVHSFVRYMGENRLRLKHWWAWYVAHPPLGAGTGIIAYLVYGSLVKPADLNPEIAAALVTPAGICGFSALAGMLSRTTIEKLADVYRRMLKAPESAVESIDTFSLELLDADQEVQGAGGAAQLRITVVLNAVAAADSVAIVTVPGDPGFPRSALLQGLVGGPKEGRWTYQVVLPGVSAEITGQVQVVAPSGAATATYPVRADRRSTP